MPSSETQVLPKHEIKTLLKLFFFFFIVLSAHFFINLARGDLFQHAGLEYSTDMFRLFVTVPVFKVTLADVG